MQVLSYHILNDMTPQQVLMWRNSLLEEFSLQIRASEKTYYLEIHSDILELAKRNNAKGKRCFDGRNRLKHVVRQQAPMGPFLESGINDDD